MVTLTPVILVDKILDIVGTTIGGAPLVADGLDLFSRIPRIIVLIFLLCLLAFLLLMIGLNKFLDFYAGGRRRPVFFDIQQTVPQLLNIDRNYKAIRQELDAILPQTKNMPKYHEVDIFQYKISGRKQRDKDWRVFMLYAIGEKPESNRQLCPRTCAILDKIPNLFQAFFSILDGGKSIPAHPGPYRGYLRYHLGLKVPEKNPPTIRIKDQYYTWKEGESVLFDDSWEHEVYNESDDIRVVFIVDVLRPMPPFPHAVNLFFQPLIQFVYAKGFLGFTKLVRGLLSFSVKR